MKELNIYFGRITNEGQMIEESQFIEFLHIFFNPHFTDYTIFPCLGMYKGSKEPCSMIQIIMDNVDDSVQKNIMDICHSYCKAWNQEYVMVTQKEVYSNLYGREL